MVLEETVMCNMIEVFFVAFAVTLACTISSQEIVGVQQKTCIFFEKTKCILKKLIVHTIHTNTRKNGSANPHKIRARGGKGSKGVSRFREFHSFNIISNWNFFKNCYAGTIKKIAKNNVITTNSPLIRHYNIVCYMTGKLIINYQ